MEKVLEFEKIVEYCLFGEKVTKDDLIDEYSLYKVKGNSRDINVVTAIILFDKVTRKFTEVFTTKDVRRYETEIDEAKRRDRIAIYRVSDVDYGDYRSILTYVNEGQSATEHVLSRVKAKYSQSFEEIK